ncbi:MAG: hypothetical protein Q7R50_08660, partial [Dehalococcoidales bacterium]|nr:hypothetical protein [Dehalococcoidales bacterium]
LLDDFAGSGDSFFRSEGNDIKGKIAKCIETLMSQNPKTGLLDIDSLEVQVVLYLATELAAGNIRERVQTLWPRHWPRCEISVVYTLPDIIRITGDADPEFDALLEKYYDAKIMDKHLKKGGPDVIHGYANCSLPLVLNHNTPNNSVYLLWVNSSEVPTIGLFPRVSRHREEA